MSVPPALDLSACRATRSGARVEEVTALREITRRPEHLIAELNHALHGKRSEKLSGDERQLAFESFNGSLRDELLNEEIFVTLDDARRKIALWRYDYNAVRPYSSLGNLTPLEARRTLALPDGAPHGALAMNDQPNYQPQTSRLSL